MNTNILKFLLVIFIGVVLWFIPAPEGVNEKAWHLMAVFIATVLGLILSPFPLGAMAIFSMTVVVALDLVPMKGALKGFSDTTIWMIACAFFISRGFIKTGFGRRVGYLFISKLGNSSLGLSYGLVMTDFIFAPAMPSTSARCGGIITPLFLSISDVYDSTPEKGTQRKIGAFLVQCIFQCNAITCAMFLTSMAGNPMIVKLVKDMGYSISWTDWALAAIVPGLISLTVIPYIIYKIYPPELKNTPEMKAIAKTKLKEMGKMTTKEWIVLAVFAYLIVFWILGSFLNIDATFTAFVGLCILLLTKALDWNDVISEKEAWHTIIWFSILMTLAAQLNKLGFIPWFGNYVAKSVENLNWMPMLLILLLVYYYIHYLMASAIAHISAMYVIFVSISIAAGAPPLLAILLFAFFSNLNMSITHYSSGPAPILFGCGYVPLAKWWKIGFIMSLVILFIWLFIGTIWWKILGLF
ncbi:anion permease [Apibacter raozihei]|uniref:anion permease n=1 Tax=Apibacter raozihei TaxID=2500547 RepID=UPI000FE402A6|nr:anion permease [Apibacter raozihei]